MSGGGGSRSYDGGGADDCGSLSIETTLNSPNPAVLPSLALHDELPVEVQTILPSNGKILVAKKGPIVAGSLTPPSLIRLIACIEGGYTYSARVLELPRGAGGAVRVRIHST